MILKFMFVIVVASQVFGEEYTPGTDEYILHGLSSLLNPVNNELLFDGPSSVSNAPNTTVNRNELPNLEQMKYYNYYAASIYYGYNHYDLNCSVCLKFKSDIDDHEVIYNNVHSTVAIVTLSQKRGEIVVIFRGTYNIWNVVLDALLINGREGDSSEPILIHQGFYIAAMSLYDDVVAAVCKYLKENPGFKVTLTGHSLGAAMARLTYYFLEENKQFPNIQYALYTYGEPRVGNKYFANFMNSRSITTVRVVARADFVPHFPPTGILGTSIIYKYYVHPQTEFWINGKANQAFCRQTFAEDPNCSMSVGPAYSAVDHLTYFDVNLGSILGQPLLFAQLPLNILNPATDLPPLPKAIENLLGGTGGSLVGVLSPALG